MLGELDIGDAINRVDLPIEILHGFNRLRLRDFRSSMNPKSTFKLNPKRVKNHSFFNFQAQEIETQSWGSTHRWLEQARIGPRCAWCRGPKGRPMAGASSGRGFYTCHRLRRLSSSLSFLSLSSSVAVITDLGKFFVWDSTKNWVRRSQIKRIGILFGNALGVSGARCCCAAWVKRWVLGDACK